MRKRGAIVRLGSANLLLQGDTSRALRVKLGKTALRRLTRHGVKSRITIRVTHNAKTTTKRLTATLKRPR